MPELAEVERARRAWDPGRGRRVEEVFARGDKRIFRALDIASLVRGLLGQRLCDAEAHGKQLMFRFGAQSFLGVHLGMSGELRTAAAVHVPERHDHLVLRLAGLSLVLRDPRLFGRVTFGYGRPPEFWRTRPPAITSSEFRPGLVRDVCRRRRASPIKAILLDQSVFPGVGNWMADEILWRARIHPRRAGGDLDEAEVRRLWREVRAVARGALRWIAEQGVDPPATWLFQHRWTDGGTCPRSGRRLVRETIGGRTTCWSPGRQRDPGRPRDGDS